MQQSRSRWVALGAMVLLCACGGPVPAPGVPSGGVSSEGANDADAGSGASDGGSGIDAGVTGSSDAGPLPASAYVGLPCDVAQLLATRCSSCHGEPLAGNAPMRLVTRDDLVAIQPASGESYADRSLVRMHSASTPMPPTGAPPADEIAAMQSWVNDGMPVSNCSEAIDAGTPVDAGPAPTTCASNTFWTDGDNGSADMNPGLSCKSCHQTKAPFKNYTYMGTVFPALHEKDTCTDGVPGGGTVEILDPSGKVLQSMTISTTSGNFHGGTPFLQSVPASYRARVTVNGKVAEMMTPVTTKNGDCNSCHTEQGESGAPGRIVAP